MIAGIVLAAGGSTRMGTPKGLLAWGGGTVLSACVAPLLAAGVGRVVVVLGCEADRMRRDGGLPADPRIRLVDNAAWSEGMASSLRAGLAECPDAEAALVVLGDQPGLTPERVRRVVGASAGGARLVVPLRDAVPSHPVLFPKALFPELAVLSGDVGAREVVGRHLSEAVVLDLPPLPDLDTPGDYAASRKNPQ